jgi:hypothetical protein
MNAIEARRRMRDALAQNRLVYSTHSGDRQEEKQVQFADIKDALKSAPLPVRSETNPGEAWVFTGVTEDGLQLAVVVGYDRPNPTVVTEWWK